MQTPVLLLLFNRPEQSRQVLARVREARPERLYVHCDGPRAHKSGEIELVEQTRALLAEIDWPCRVETLFRDQNWGCRMGVSDAITWFFGHEEMGIILEDDNLPDPSFFPYCEELLRRYADNPTVMHIGGLNLAEKWVHEPMQASYVFTKFCFVWGWASWRRAWQKMTLDMAGFEDFARSGAIAEVVPGRAAQTYLLDKFEATFARKNNSWAYAWFYSILKNKGLCIAPRKNLVENTGVGTAGATHTSARESRLMLPAGTLDFPLRHPAHFDRDMALERRFFLTGQKSWARLWAWYFLKKVRGCLNLSRKLNSNSL